ncbi:MAG: thioredoxin domain-containing protein [Xanthomonadales bacterium]|nr:thioredoxin domain-containing protein [Xanthomonadales bacterium]
MSNQLAAETSPYLLQHADNPVHWYPWGEQALTLAREQNKPILLSIGYAACHWCHVMAHESFEDEATAAVMNQHFVNIKVDREERPDLDGIYMSAVTGMTGQGGWPMTVFLAPDGQPFYAGTYFPPQPRYGMPSFQQVLETVSHAWVERQDEVQRSAATVTQHLQETAQHPQGGELSNASLEQAAAKLLSNYDSVHGGFGDAPKFPQPMALEFGLREYLRNGNQDLLNAATTTLQRMANGGIYDLLGGGFARYATDIAWLVPHFEKMLYDNAQLARVYLHAWQITGEPRFREVVEQTLDYLLHEMHHEDGGFYSSEDADSEGVEGKFYVWSAAEIRAALGADAEVFMQACGVSDAGNWEGTNILHRPNDGVEISASARQKLFDLRAQRIRPGLDDKVLTAWNGLALAALAEAGRVLGRADYLQAALQNAEFIDRELRLENGRLLRSWKAGHGARYSAYLEDYACLADGLLALYESTFDERWYVWANELAGLMLQHFQDKDGVGLYDTADDHEQLLLRPRDLQDNAMPSGNARAASVMFRLGLLSGDGEYPSCANDSVAAMSSNMASYPMGFGEWLSVASVMLGTPQELALIGDAKGLEEFKQLLNSSYRPNLGVAAGAEQSCGRIPLLAGRPMVNGKAAAYLCQQFSCSRPVTTAVELAALLTAGD